MWIAFVMHCWNYCEHNVSEMRVCVFDAKFYKNWSMRDPDVSASDYSYSNVALRFESRNLI